jgi:glycosyltransferase involved in cell wall biosynthesis
VEPLISLIVTTKNSQRTLAPCLESARRQDYKPIELIVVDNASTDATPEIARRFADAVIEIGPERSAQRNAGIKAAHGEYILILDADMVLDASVVRAALDASNGGAQAVVIPEESFGQGFWSACKAFERSFYERDALVSAARFFSRQRVLDAGGFDEALTGPEDWDLSMRVSGSVPVAFAAARILHDEGTQSLRSLYEKKYYYGRSMPAFVRKHGKDALKRMSPLRPSLMRGLGRMLRHPVLTGGLMVMKSTEFLGIIAGTLARPRRSEALYRSTGT